MNRIVEPEVMDTVEAAVAYDAMEHGEVDWAFVDRVIALGANAGHFLDVGTGPAQIPILLAQHCPDIRITAIDLSTEMLKIALRHTPHAACIVPEKREERTTEGGLEVAKDENRLAHFIAPLRAAGCRVSIFIAADARQIEAARRAITRHMKRAGRVWIRIFPDLPVTKKPTEVRMGKGKGSVEFWAAAVKPGRIMFEVDGVPPEGAHEALRLGSAKLPVRTKIVSRIGE